jgi:hypothetical protein
MIGQKILGTTQDGFVRRQPSVLDWVSGCRRIDMLRVALTVVILLVVGAGRASGAPILDFTGGALFFSAGNIAFGWEFRTASPITVDSLGFWDEGGNGLVNSHQVRLWSGDGSSLLASTTITNASMPVSSTSPDGRWLFNNISPVVLPIGDYVVGASFVPGSPNPECTLEDCIREETSLTTTLTGVTFIEPRNGGGGLSFPDTPAPGVVHGYFGPNLQATVVAPEPGTLILLISGLILLVCLRPQAVRPTKTRRLSGHERLDGPRKMKTARWTGLHAAAFGLATLIALAGGQVTASVIVAPNGLATVEGNSSDNFTFSNLVPSVRFQQIYNASQFSGPVLINQIAFRPDGSAGKAFTATLPTVQIDLATTTRSIDLLSFMVLDVPGIVSSVFSKNLDPGTDKTVFSGPLPLSSADAGPSGGPKDFDIIITLQTPFAYDPANGNLVFDLRNFSTVETTFFDASTSIDQSIMHVDAANVNATVGNRFGLGLVTEFIGAVPEPSSFALLSACFVGFELMRRRRKAM